MPAEMVSSMFCNCRLRKPAMLMMIISIIVFINYSLITWLIGDKNSDNGPMAQVRIVPTEKEHPLFEQKQLRQEIEHEESTEKPLFLKSKTVVKSAKPILDDTFFDPQVISAMNEDDELLVEFRDGEMMGDIPPVNAMINDLDLGIPSEFVEPNEKNGREAKMRMNSRPSQPSPEMIDLRIPPSYDEDSLEEKPVNPNGFLWQSQKAYGDKVSHQMRYQSYEDFDSEEIKLKGPEAIYRWNVTGKVAVDLPESSFSGATFEPGQKLIKQMMNHAWEGYKRVSWGKDDLKPWSNSSQTGLGNSHLGLTIIDALDTLYLMGMKEEFDKGAEWVFNELDFDQEPSIVSLFETNIRLLGGLLSSYALTKDDRFKAKAIDLGDRFMRNFESRVFPSNNLQLKNLPVVNKQQQYQMRYAGQHHVSASLAQIGTFSLEFGYLSHISGNSIYKEKALAIIAELEPMETKLPGLYPSHIVANKTQQNFEMFSLSGEMDSFYEYLLKYWLLTGKQDKTHHSMYKKAVEGIKEHLIANVDGKKYLISKSFGESIMQIEHLACFAPGMLGLGAHNEGDYELLKLAEELTETCYLTYHNQEHGIGCEVLSVPSLKPVRNGDYYHLRPEVIESIFYMWRLTKDPKYRKWGYEIAQNLEATCRVPHGGYSGIKSVNMTPVVHNNHMESFFLAETLKYLYLMFCDDEVVALDKWVFNTEAHPLPIINAV